MTRNNITKKNKIFLVGDDEKDQKEFALTKAVNNDEEKEKKMLKSDKSNALTKYQYLNSF